MGYKKLMSAKRRGFSMRLAARLQASMEQQSFTLAKIVARAFRELQFSSTWRAAPVLMMFLLRQQTVRFCMMRGMMGMHPLWTEKA